MRKTVRKDPKPWIDCDMQQPELVERRHANTMPKPTPEQQQANDAQVRLLEAELHKRAVRDL